MLRLKSCPKCRGDLIIDRDMYGWYEQCIQCGYLHPLEPLPKIEQPAMEEHKKELVKVGAGASGRGGRPRTPRSNKHDED
ncbi:MAG: hypothetical protein HY671_15140 [Chloroflexi bacterium]|nr:hypothetical protein [Chloroflexota bacterium]